MTQSLPLPLSVRPHSERSGAPLYPPASERTPDLPGCEPFFMTEHEAATCEGRVEAWNARTRTAWRVSAPTSIYHELPSGRLGRLAERIASVRGSPVECFGSADLVRRDAVGRREWILQADEMLYLHPGRGHPSGAAMEVGEDVPPDVLLEVDHTTDVRRWKLGMYMEWGFPELWVLVPWRESVRARGLEIHVRMEGGGYRRSRESVAIPGWRVEEIHQALTEEPVSEATWRAVERVGRAMGMREGTRPEDDPLTRSLSAAARAEGRTEGWAEAVRAVLRARGITTAPGFTADSGLFAGVGLDTLMVAAQTCTDEEDFLRRIAGARA